MSFGEFFNHFWNWFDLLLWQLGLVRNAVSLCGGPALLCCMACYASCSVCLNSISSVLLERDKPMDKHTSYGRWKAKQQFSSVSLLIIKIDCKVSNRAIQNLVATVRGFSIFIQSIGRQEMSISLIANAITASPLLLQSTPRHSCVKIPRLFPVPYVC